MKNCLKYLFVLMLFGQIQAFAQPSTNKPPDNSPLVEKLDIDSIEVASQINHILSFDPTLLPRGLYAGHYYHKFNSSQYFLHFGYGRSVSEDHIFAGRDIEFKTDGLTLTDTQHIFRDNLKRMHHFEFGIGASYNNRKQLKGVNIQLNAQYDFSNIPTSKYVELKIEGAEKVNYRSSRLEFLIGFFHHSSNPRPVFFSGFQVGISKVNYTMNSSSISPLDPTLILVSNSKNSINLVEAVLRINFGIAW